MAGPGYFPGMKRFVPLAALVCVLSLLALPLWAAPKKMGKDGEVPTAGLELAKTATQITGIAISPLLGVSVIGCYQWFGADTPAEKAALPWFANPGVWLVGFLLVGAAAVKDTMGATVPPGWKKPLDVLDATENKVSGLVAAGAVVPVLVAASSKFIAASAYAPLPTVEIPGLAMINLAAIDFSWLLTILMVPLAIVVHLIVFIASHAINVLILLSPWGAVDAALKAGRTAILGLVTATAWIDPVVGATISAVIILFSWLISGWAFRLTTFGTIFCWEFFTRRRKRFSVLADGNKVFLGRRVEGVPIRTYGRLHQADNGALTFRYRPWLVMPEKQVAIPRDGLCVGCGLFYSEVLGHNPRTDRVDTLLLLPPRYLEHEELFARTYHISGTCDVGLRRAWTWLKETVGLKPRRSEPLPA
jgi:hypothetical protein